MLTAKLDQLTHADLRKDSRCSLRVGITAGNPFRHLAIRKTDFVHRACSEVAGNKKSGLRMAQAGIFLGTRLIALGSPAVIPFDI
jgi:hypothetical protein